MRLASPCDASSSAFDAGSREAGSLGQRPFIAPSRAVICSDSFWSAVPVEGRTCDMNSYPLLRCAAKGDASRFASSSRAKKAADASKPAWMVAAGTP